jgi:hypothetical protein
MPEEGESEDEGKRVGGGERGGGERGGGEGWKREKENA